MSAAAMSGAFCSAQALAVRLAPRSGTCARRGLVVADAGPAAPRRMPAVTRPLVPSRELQAFVPDKAVTRGAVLKSLSAYVKEHGLQDAVDRKKVNCDPALRSLLGVDSCSFLGMSKYISPHLRKPEEVGGKYVEEARLVEEAWLAENKSNPKPRKAAKRSPASQDEAKAKGTGLWRPVALSPDLAKVCGKKEMPRQEVIKSVWTYIRANNLQGKPGEPVKCDALLKSVFKAETVTARAIMGGISPHIIKK